MSFLVTISKSTGMHQFSHQLVFQEESQEFSRLADTIHSLNLQHYLHRELFGYLVHPSIPTGNPTLRVADIGTGTG